MSKHLLLYIFLLSFSSASVAQEKSVKESWQDLKKSFNPAKAFIYPAKDTSVGDVQSFANAVRSVKGVSGAILKTTAQGVSVTINANSNLTKIWNSLPEEMRERYTLGQRTPEGMVLIDNQKNNVATANTGSSSSTSTSREKSTYEKVEEDVNSRSRSDTAKKPKTGMGAQTEYNEKMRERNLKMAKGTMSYENPKDYDAKAESAKGEYVEYKINGKKFAMYNNGKSNFSSVTSRLKGLQEYKLMGMGTGNNKNFYIRFTNPGRYPLIRKFEFGKEPIKSVAVETYSTVENRDVVVEFRMKLDGPSIGNTYLVFGTIGPYKDPRDNVVSGSIEIIYFEPGVGGIIDAKFNLVIKGGKDSKGNPQPDLNITDGRMRLRMKS